MTAENCYSKEVKRDRQRGLKRRVSRTEARPGAGVHRFSRGRAGGTGERQGGDRGAAGGDKGATGWWPPEGPRTPPDLASFVSSPRSRSLHLSLSCALLAHTEDLLALVPNARDVPSEDRWLHEMGKTFKKQANKQTITKNPQNIQLDKITKVYT